MKNKNGIKKITSFLILCFFFVAVNAGVYAQEKTVTGKIIDEAKQTLPGVTIMVKGTSIGSVTDIDGNYSISGVTNDNVLVISFIGMGKQEVLVGDKTSINVTLKPDAFGIEEVVVNVGYGVQKKATLTGSIETISSEVFVDRAVSSPALSLQGQTPGLIVTRSSSQPGKEDIDFQIRGATSVNRYDNNGNLLEGAGPLIIIDGSPAINTDAFYNMNSTDIESISVLKDGAAAIYGSRAANGVILVTTKKGSGDFKVEFNSNVRMNTVGIQPPTPSMEDFATTWLDATDQDLAYAPSTVNYKRWLNRETLERFQREEAGIYKDAATDEVYMGPARIYDEMFGSSISHQQNLSISGATEKSDFRISTGYTHNRGMLQPAYDGEKQMNFRANYNFTMNKWLKFEAGMSYLNTNVSNPSTGLDASAISYDPPFWPAKNPQGQWYANFGSAGGRNAIASVTDGGRQDVINNQTKINLAAIIQIQPDLTFRAMASMDKSFSDDQEYVINILTYDWFGELAENSVNSTTYIQREKKDRSYETYGGFLNYFKNISDHSISAMLGASAELIKHNGILAHRQGFIDQGVYDVNLGSIESLVKAEGGAGHSGLYGFVGRLNYNYKNKYLVEVSGRRDGSSRFDEGFKWSNYGNTSLGWVISDESIMESLSFISFLKLRASYGETGNFVGIDEFEYLSLMQYGTGILGNPASLQNSARVDGITSNERNWERVSMSNIGADFQLMDNKIYGSLEFFKKTNDEMFINIKKSAVLGGEAPTSNDGILETKGWEFILGLRDKKGDFGYDIKLSLANTQNELVFMEGVSTYSAGKNENIQGYPINSYFLYQTDGLFANEDEVAAYYAEFGNGGEIPPSTGIGNNATSRLRPGDVIKKDLDSDGSITSSGNIDEMNSDVEFMGDAATHHNFSLNMAFKYKSFDLTAFFQGVWNQNVLRTGHMAYPFARPWSNQTIAFTGKTWNEDNTGAAFPRLTLDNTRAGWNWANNDFMLVNSRYVRLKALVLGYNFKLKNDQKIRIYFSGNDLFEITSVKDGYDPEYGESTQSPYPFSRTYSLGVNVTF